MTGHHARSFRAEEECHNYSMTTHKNQKQRLYVSELASVGSQTTVLRILLAPKFESAIDCCQDQGNKAHL